MATETCFSCGYSAWTSTSGERGVRVECDQCGVSLSGWCADRMEARWLHIRRAKLMKTASEKDNMTGNKETPTPLATVMDGLKRQDVNAELALWLANLDRRVWESDQRLNAMEAADGG